MKDVTAETIGTFSLLKGNFVNVADLLPSMKHVNTKFCVTKMNHGQLAALSPLFEEHQETQHFNSRRGIPGAFA